MLQCTAQEILSFRCTLIVPQNSVLSCDIRIFSDTRHPFSEFKFRHSDDIMVNDSISFPYYLAICHSVEEMRNE